jgi:hypothetical protein
MPQTTVTFDYFKEEIHLLHSREARTEFNSLLF